MNKFKVGDKVRIVKSTYVSMKLRAGNEGVIWKDYRGVLGVKLSIDSGSEDGLWSFYEDELELVNDSVSNRKQIQQSLLKLYDIIFSFFEPSIKSEEIVDTIKKHTGIEHIFGDTILRELRQLRQEGELDYECPNRKERIYIFKQLKQ